jgi:hypothetical protein
LTQYDRILAQHNIVRLKPGADLQVLTIGDMKLTRRGHLQYGDFYFNALDQFVDGWVSNLPTLQLLFTAVRDSVERRAEFEKRMDEESYKVVEQMMRGETPSHNSFLASEQGTQIEVGRDSCSGAIFVVVNTLLQGLRDDLNSGSLWKSTAKEAYGYSLGQVIEAGSNNFRHYDEWNAQWMDKKAFTPKQQASVDVIAKALNEPDPLMLSGNVCGRLLLSICNADFEQFESVVMIFAQVLVNASEAHSTANP